jgi:RHS repeat-associated protein
MKDWISGEEVNYTYDALSRLGAAWTTGPEWGQSYSYDGFGNRTAATVTKGTAPTSSLAYDPASNRIVGVPYDANGNLGGSGYDVENRLIQYGLEQYGYAPTNQRVWKQWMTWPEGVTIDAVHFYGVEGRKLGSYRFSSWEQEQPQVDTLSEDVYFGGKLLYQWGYVVRDRIGSVRARWTQQPGGGWAGERLNYYPWGEERSTTTPQNRDKYATYFRDGTGLDYANQRYYASTLGGFFTPDRYISSGGLANPQSWNRYRYADGDPINGFDPQGLTTIFNCSYGMYGFGDCGWKPVQDLSGGVYIPGSGEGASGYVWVPSPPMSGAGAGTDGQKSRDWCDRDDPTNAKVREFIEANTGAAQKLGEATGLDPDFLLAWSAGEVDYGRSKIATQNNNFFNLTVGKENVWIGAVACDTLAGTPAAAYACFTSGPENPFSVSGSAALLSQNSRYLKAAQKALGVGGGVAAIAQAVADAGFDPRTSYGSLVQDAFDAIQRRKNCE